MMLLEVRHRERLETEVLKDLLILLHLSSLQRSLISGKTKPNWLRHLSFSLP
jgi:hypothetical protein